MDRNAYIPEHLYETRMCRGMQLWVAEYFDAFSYFMNVELRAISEYIIGPQAKPLRETERSAERGRESHPLAGEESTVERPGIEPLQAPERIAAPQLNGASGEHPS